MRIAVVAHALRGGGGVSVGKNIIASLGRIAPYNEYLFSVPAGLEYEEVCKDIPNSLITTFQHGGNLLRRYYYEKVYLSSVIENFNPDVVLCLGNVALRDVKVPQAVLLHNPYYVYSSVHFGPAANLRLKLLVALQRFRFSLDLPSIKLLFCQTIPMSERVRSTYNYKGDIKILPNAVSQLTLDGKDLSCPPLPKALEPYVHKRFLFYLTAYYTHKNIEFLIKLFTEKKDILKDYAAVITISGRKSKLASRLLKSISASNLQDKIINVGPLPQSELAAYYAHSYALFMPTLLESFSASYLESMYFGVPIVTSDLDFARAVCGDAAIYFNPWDINSAVNAIQKIETHANDVVASGRIRLSSLFSTWDQIVAEMLTALESVTKQVP